MCTYVNTEIPPSQVLKWQSSLDSVPSCTGSSNRAQNPQPTTTPASARFRPRQTWPTRGGERDSISGQAPSRTQEEDETL